MLLDGALCPSPSTAAMCTQGSCRTMHTCRRPPLEPTTGTWSHSKYISRQLTRLMSAGSSELPPGVSCCYCLCLIISAVKSKTWMQMWQCRHYLLLTCRYRSTYKADPADYHPPSKSGGGFWFEDRQRKAADNCPQFLATTTYKAELLEAPETTSQQLQQSMGCSSTLVSYKVARDRRAQSASPRLGDSLSSTLSSTTAVTSTGALIGYRTTYGVTTAQATSLAAERAAAASPATARPVSCTAAERPRLAVSG